MKRKVISLLLCICLALAAVGGAEASGSSSWVNTTIYGNVTEGMEVNLKDDFNLAVNYEKLRDMVIPEGEFTNGPIVAAGKLVDERTRALMTDDTLEGRDAQYIHILYNAYMDVDARNALGVTPLAELCSTISGCTTIEELTALMLDETAAQYIEFPFQLAVMNSLNDPDKSMAGLGKSFFLAEDASEYRELTPNGELALEANKTLILYLLQRCGYPEAAADAMFANAIAAETILAAEALSVEDRYSPDYYERTNNEFTPDEADALMPGFPLKEMMANYGFGSVDKLLVKDLGYFRGFNNLYTQENLPLVQDYLIVHSAFLLADFLDPECVEMSAAAGFMQRGTESQLSLEEMALSAVKGNLPDMVQRCYLQKYNAAEKKAVVTELCEKAIEEYKLMIMEEDWLSGESRANALRKLETMQIRAVYPDKWEDDSALVLTEGMSYLECHAAVEAYRKARSLASMGTGEDPDIWGGDTLQANGHYNVFSNSITIDLGILSEDYYPEDGSIEKLYGGIGYTIGHEISHAFDKDGSQFDADGKLNDWWTDADRAEYERRSQKLVDYFDAIPLFEGTNANGRLILGEAAADITGVKVMLRLAKKIGNFDYDLFFRTYANTQACSATREVAEYLAVYDAHPSYHLRVNVVAQQFDEFLETYGITEGDGMYLPKDERILIW